MERQKRGMNNLSQTLAIELAPKGIRSNIVSPGQVPTEQQPSGVPARNSPTSPAAIPLQRVGNPLNIAAVLYLVSSR